MSMHIPDGTNIMVKRLLMVLGALVVLGAGVMVFVALAITNIREDPIFEQVSDAQADAENLTPLVFFEPGDTAVLMMTVTVGRT